MRQLLNVELVQYGHNIVNMANNGQKPGEISWQKSVGHIVFRTV